MKSSFPLLSRFIMDLSGQIKQMLWVPNSSWGPLWTQPRKQCDVHALCGPFGVCNDISLPFCNCIKGFRENSPLDWALRDWSRGCLRNTKLECAKDRFYTMPNTRMPDNPKSVQCGSASDCESKCLKDCSYTAYSYNFSGCFVWQGDLLHLQNGYDVPGGGTLFVRLAASELPVRHKSKVVIIISVVGGVFSFLVLLVVAWLVCRWGKRTLRRSNVVEGGLIAFQYNELQRTTRNFSENLGGGSFGSVFKGVLPDSSLIVVKLLEGVRQGEKQFRTKVSTIGTIQHVNLVRLREFCSQGLHKLLVYEYMPNGSLDNKLFNEDSSLDWKTRYRIALGIARGLSYLHEQCRDC